MAQIIYMAEEKRLERFVDAQRENYAIALAEVRAGRKRSHWMWYIFPQIAGLGQSVTSQFYALNDLAEATAYLHHPVLGPRLIQLCDELIKGTATNPARVFGTPDDLKLRSSMTLFSLGPDTDPVFEAVLQKFFHGVKDDRTVGFIEDLKKV